MSGLAFTKMHGAGNDYVFVDGFETQLPAAPGELAIRISNRNFGIGSDGLVFMEPSQTPEADVRMRMWNADGSEGFGSQLMRASARQLGGTITREIAEHSVAVTIAFPLASGKADPENAMDETA